MEVIRSRSSDTGEGAIFQCPMMKKFGLRSDSSEDSSILQKRGFILSTSFNGLSTPSVKFNKDMNQCLRNNNNNYCHSTTDFTYHDSMKRESLITSTEDSVINDAHTVAASERMRQIFEGLNEHGDSQNPPEMPPWLDLERFNLGRKFYEKYLFCIFFADLLSLLMMFSVSRVLRPLIYTDRSDTPMKAMRRYVSTICHIITWFTGDVWNPNDHAHKDILKVRSIHNKSSNILNSSVTYDHLKTLTVQDKGHKEPSCPFSPAIRHDLQTQTRRGLPLESDDITTFYISQWDMVLTQYAFLGLILAHPYQMGAWYVKEKELDGLVHFWRGIGWLLGIEDKYNFCNGTLAETRALCNEMEKLVMIPSLSKADWNHEHMSTSLIDGINFMVPLLAFPSMFRFLTDTLGVSVPAFIKNMNREQLFRYWLLRFVFHILFIIPGVIFLFNQLLKLSLQLIQKQRPSWVPNSIGPIVTATPFEYT
ncbi:hypothetical protein SK128_014045 [Halocaridina rubra]|uniref:ER-bound oxygenase mpaB/mpaB'/Rubber oxygenase catalytic domain-containing protein n=1 Tax=Halocaridina rubra TaxID=373956 RepID=A0AAN8X2B7_HALRR